LAYFEELEGLLLASQLTPLLEEGEAEVVEVEARLDIFHW